MRTIYNIMETPTFRRLLNDYRNAYAIIEDMNYLDAIKYLQELKMHQGLCKYCFYQFNVIDITEWLPENFDEFSYYWNTPLQYYTEDKHPKLGLITRISHIEKELELLKLPY